MKRIRRQLYRSYVGNRQWGNRRRIRPLVTPIYRYCNELFRMVDKTFPKRFYKPFVENRHTSSRFVSTKDYKMCKYYMYHTKLWFKRDSTLF